MPLFDTTYNKRSITEAINELSGAPIPFLKRFTKGGIGSRRMIIEGKSDFFRPYTNADHYPTYSNIEIRPKAIIIHIHKTLDNFAWVLPFESFSINAQGQHVEIQAEGYFLLFREGYKINHAFVKKVQALQIAHNAL